MPRPTIEAIEDNVITWRAAMEDMNREIDKMESALKAIVSMFDDEDFMDEMDDVMRILDIAEAALK